MARSLPELLNLLQVPSATSVRLVKRYTGNRRGPEYDAEAGRLPTGHAAVSTLLEWSEYALLKNHGASET